MAKLDSFPNQQPQDSDEVAAAHDSNGDGTLDDTVNWTWSGMKSALDSAGYARLSKNETVTGAWEFKGKISIYQDGGPPNSRRMTITRREIRGDLFTSTSIYARGNNNDEGLILGNSEPEGPDKPMIKAHLNGNVGIGDPPPTTPSYALDTAGDIRAQDKLLTDFSDPSTFSAREVKSGTGAPSDSEGKNGDIYIQTN
jgi:hypothetical protein